MPELSQTDRHDDPLERRGPIDSGDLALWSDKHVSGLGRLVDVMHKVGSVLATGSATPATQGTRTSDPVERLEA
jgi:hypothetical protein